MICALLIFQTPELPAPPGRLSSWLDRLITPREQVLARLEAQASRRLIKSRPPVGGIPLDPRGTYIAIGRHPHDLAVSLSQLRVRELARPVGLLGISVAEELWPGLVRAATFGEARARAAAEVRAGPAAEVRAGPAAEVRAGSAAEAPDPAGGLKDPAAFFRRGYSGAGREVLNAAGLKRYCARTARLGLRTCLTGCTASPARLGRVEPAVAG